ncbi:hypothetical protein [Azoarcus olearius]|uniref:hypothetical protein n=1 Tax=Azoarcus sp. (strain BH72) TaxID=418699 RepID=UPI0012ED1234|nr:hypothetical protein [Azoarcus olearius]
MEEEDWAAEQKLIKRLKDIYEEQCQSGNPDPFVIETLADFTENSKEAADLYLFAIQQCENFPAEPVHTKQIGLASQLLDDGNEEQAKQVLEKAMLKAWEAKDREAINEIKEMLGGFSAG